MVERGDDATLGSLGKLDFFLVFKAVKDWHKSSPE
jgi:hypothetical protein